MGKLKDFSDFGGQGLIIRRAVLKDLDAVYEIEKNNSHRPYSYNVTAELFENGEVFVAFLCGSCAGYVAVSIVFEDAEIINIAVDKSVRGQGIGGMLLKAAIAECKAKGAKRVLLEVEDTNHTAIKLYQKTGFKQIFLREKYYGENSAVIMEYQTDTF